MLVHEIPRKMKSIWRGDVKAIVEIWSNYFVSLDEFKDFLDKEVGFSRSKGGRAWIVDSSQAKGVFRQEIQDYIGSDAFKLLAENGIKYFITITSQVSSATKMTVASYVSKGGPFGLELVEVGSEQEAIAWLKQSGI